ncbi:MAG: hypothetical protein FWG98_09885 [Candidatus Cloacimonetes bacterium]|nr:hypothetical protein [Candidatus Cloacimonadota bacterium]
MKKLFIVFSILLLLITSVFTKEIVEINDFETKSASVNVLESYEDFTYENHFINYHQIQSKSCKSPVKPEPRITFNVESAKEWNEAVNTIKTGGDGQSYLINIRNDFELSGTDNPTFGNATDISVEIKGKRTASASPKGIPFYYVNLLHIDPREIKGKRTISASPKGNPIYYGGLLHIGSGQNVTIKDLTLIGTPYRHCPPVHVNGVNAVFTMQGTASAMYSTEVGVVVSSGIFNLQDNAAIANNNMAVTVGVDGIFYMSGGSISNNPPPTQSRIRSVAGIIVSEGQFIMSGGTISKNVMPVSKSRHYVAEHTRGGVIRILTGGIFTMIDGVISENDGAHAIMVDSDSVFNMLGGVIHGNTNGGVHVRGGEFNMMNGTISGNKSYNGGGLYAVEDSRFKMFGGTIYGSKEYGAPEHLANHASNDGAALYGSTVFVERRLQYGDGTDILPHVEGELDYTNHTIIGRTSHDNIDMENTIKKIKTHFMEEQ